MTGDAFCVFISLTKKEKTTVAECAREKEPWKCVKIVVCVDSTIQEKLNPLLPNVHRLRK